MKRPPAMRKTLAELAMRTAAQSGLDTVSLRNIARQAGCSTAVIFQNFEGKAELLLAAAELAARQDAELHNRLLAGVEGLITGHLAFSDFLSSYIEMRVAVPQARFLSEVLIKLCGDDRYRAVLLRWHERRKEFWREVLGQYSFGERIGAIVAEYCLMEEIYAYSLHDQPRFQLLQRETVRALTDACFHDGAASGLTNRVIRMLQWKSYEERRQSSSNRAIMPEQMLGHAVEIIKRDGIGALNQRSLAQRANVSSSMIAYHFNDMKTFTNEAIWRALVKGIPGEFDPDSLVTLPRTIPEWVEFLHATLLTPPSETQVGFYVRFSRMTAEASLLACSEHTLVPLMAYLREIDGWGTYRLSRNIPVLARNMHHEHAAAFAVWIKAEALLHHSGLIDPAEGRDRIANAMASIFPHKQLP